MPPQKLPPSTHKALSDYLVPWLHSAGSYNLENLDIAWADGSIARMMQNENPLPPSQKVKEAIVSMLDKLNYYPNQALPLKEKLAEKYGLKPETIHLANGSSEIIDNMMRVFISPGDEIILPEPTFSLFTIRAKLTGANVVQVPVKRETLETDIDGMLEAITAKTKLIVLVTPNNPTGILIEQEKILEVLKTGIPTLIDEAYSEYYPDLQSNVHLIKDYPNAFISHTFSKAYGLAGIRLGYLVGCREIVRALDPMKLPWNLSLLTIVSAMAILENPQEIEEKVSYNNKWMKIFYTECNSLGLRASYPPGNYMLIDAKPFHKTSTQIYEAALKNKILVKKINPIHGNECLFRISPGTENDNLRLINFLKNYFVNI